MPNKPNQTPHLPQKGGRPFKGNGIPKKDNAMPSGLPGGPVPGGSGIQFDPKTLKRIFSYTRKYKAALVLVVICILLSAVAGAASGLFLQILIDEYIIPLLAAESPVFTGLLHALLTLAVVYLVGVIASLLYNRIMVTIAQGILKQIRDEMFVKMQRLPIRYFDTHTHGDTMSLYTNDTDTLRQMLAQSTPQLISSAFSIVAVLACMLYLSIPLTIAAVVTMYLCMKISGFTMGKISFFFIEQQRTLADPNSYSFSSSFSKKVSTKASSIF